MSGFRPLSPRDAVARGMTIFVDGEPFGEWVQPIAVGPDRFHDHINERQATMPTAEAGIPGTPHNAADIEAILLKNMDLEGAADRQAEFEQASHAAKLAAERRNAAIIALVENGWPGADPLPTQRQRQVAEALGITRARVSHIVAAGRREAS